ncbi:MAG: hypothetical protein ACOC5R_05310 [Elusimicrobiota bacterium]
MAVTGGVLCAIVPVETIIVSVSCLFLGWLSNVIKPWREFASTVDTESMIGYLFFPILLIARDKPNWIVMIPLVLGLLMFPQRIKHLKKDSKESYGRG